MKNVGKILKEHIESNGLMKGKIAEEVGISYNYLSTIFKKSTIDARLLEKLCVAVGLDPAIMFDVPEETRNSYKDIWAQTVLGNAQVQINSNENLRKLLAEKERVIAEKERTIQILMASAGIKEPGQNRDNCDN